MQYKIDHILDEVKMLKNNTKKYKTLQDHIDLFYNDLETQKRLQNKVAFKFPLELFQQISDIIAETKKSKVNICFLSFIQNLLNLQILTQNTHENIMNYLLKIQEINKEQLQIKLQQTFFLLVGPTTLSISNSVFIEKVLKMLILMKNSKIQLIQNTSISSLDQIISNLIKQSIENDNNTEKVRLLAQILYDFIVISDDQKSQWWPKNVPVDKEIGFCVLFQALNELSLRKFHQKEIQNMFKFNLFPIIKKNLNMQQNSHLFMLNLLRGAIKTIIYLEEEFEQLDLFLKFMQQKELHIIKYLAFECINYFISQSEVLYLLLVSLDFKKQQNENIFIQILNVLLVLTKEISQLNEQQFIKYQQISPKVSKAIESNDIDIEFPQITYTLIMKQCLDFYLKLSISLEIIFSSRLGIKLGEKKQKNSPNFDTFYLIFDQIWKNIYQSIKYLLTKQTDEQQFQNILNTIQTFTNLSGSIGNVNASDQFIKAICNYSLPKNADMTPKNIQTNKMVLNISHCLGNLLDTNGWTYILAFLQKSESLYNKNRIARDNTQEEQIKLSDIQILQNTLDYLFQNSANYDNNHLLTLLNSLFQITFEYISGEKNISIKIADNQKQKQHIFSIQKLYEAIKVNLYRIDIMWELVSANFLVLCTNKNQYFRERSVETLGDFILEAFQFLTDSYVQGNHENGVGQNNISLDSNDDEGKNSNRSAGQGLKKPQRRCLYKQKEKWNCSDWQNTLFQPWIDVIQCRYNETKDIIMNNILKILQNNGHVINKNGWSQLLNILSEISTDCDQNYIYTGIKCIELLVNQYLANLHHSKLSTLLTIIENFKKKKKKKKKIFKQKQKKDDNNINYLSCDMFWHIGDYLVKNHNIQQQSQSTLTKEEFGSLMQSILEKLLFLCIDPHAEARNSAQHIFSSLIVHNYAKLQSIDILNKMVWELAENVLINVKQEVSKNNQDKLSQWEETAINTCQHLCKIIKRCLQISDNSSEDVSVTACVVDRIVQIFFKYLQLGLNDLTIESIKSIRDIFKLKPHICLSSNSVQYQNLLLFLCQSYQIVPNNIKNIKNIFQKVIPECLGLIEDFCLLQIVDDDVDFNNHIDQIFILFHYILVYPQLVSEDINMKQQKIFFDEKLYQELLEKISKNKNLSVQYNQFIHKIINIPCNSLVIDSLIRKIIPLIVNQIKGDSSMEKQIVFQHILSIKQGILSKNSHQYLEISKNNKVKPIWIICTETLIEICTHLIHLNPQIYLNDLYNILCNYFIENKYSIDNLIKYYTPEQIKDYFESEKLLLECIIQKFLPFIQTSFMPQFGYVLYCNSQLKIENESNISQYNLDDLGINFNRNCLNYLFRAVSAEFTSNIDQSVLFLPFLLNRSRIILESFIQEQKMMTSVCYKATKIKDIDYLFGILKNLSVHKNSFKIIQNTNISEYNLPFEILNNDNICLNGQFGHLIYLLPLFKQCLSIQQDYLQNQLNSIFQKIYEIFEIDKYYK